MSISRAFNCPIRAVN